MSENTTTLRKLLPNEDLEELQGLVSASETPIWKYWEEFIEKYLRTGKSPVTVRNVRDALRFVIRELSIYTIEDLNKRNYFEDALFEARDSRGFKNTTFNSYRKNVNTYMLWLSRRAYIGENNVGKMEKCKEVPEEQLALSTEQVLQLVAQIHTRRQSKLLRLRNALFIDLLRFTGARPCELLNLRIEDIKSHGAGYKIVIRGKKQKGRPRYYPCPSYLRDTLDAYLEHRYKLRPDESYLFISSSKKQRWTYKGVLALFRKLSSELGFTVTCYGFRRFVATKLNSEGVPIDQIRDYLGHTRNTTTQRYIERSCVLTENAALMMGKCL
jgi:site-specific recombinase XerD